MNKNQEIRNGEKKKFKLFNIFIFLMLIFFSANIASSSQSMTKQELIYNINYYINKADALDGDNSERVEYLKKASELAKSFTEKYPNDDAGYAYLAYSLGSIIKNASFYKKISLTIEAKTAADKALQININNSMALFILGMINRESAELEGVQRTLARQFLSDIVNDASFEKAIKYFQRAVELDANNIQYLYELGKTYEKINEMDEAKSIYNRILKLEIKNGKDKKYVEKTKRRINKLI
ncbi:tetratricopeptide repeat protein [Thermodesulfovibrio thiophilus]|uniref:tetratricopeptide repeat protein n=1 Tax=Thermodesulfovibrio thiophilus TaxID=340095 RepID=UPI0017D96EC8|nr:tetratricopeptide repeat protein [Thermodesulfovibrio thiophilus]HHW21125.1 tetratricopeptide repeat protein [Thermodesulfovibrio thiophilus]